MSEYQYVDFVAVDGPVTDKNLEFMREQSTRAQITPWRFTNEYHYGDFHGDAAEMLRRGYDAHLHYANFGIRKLAFRLPGGLPCNKTVFRQYAVADSLTWQPDKRGAGGILTIYPEADAGTYEDLLDDETWLDHLLPLRQSLIEGDLRPLFLGWLACVYDDAKLPPIPAGLKQLTPALKALAEFYELPGALLRAASADSPPAPELAERQALIQTWVAKQDQAALRKVVGELLAEDGLRARSEYLAQIAAQQKVTWPTVNKVGTIEELRETAGL